MKFWVVIFCVCYVGRGHCSTNILSSTPHTCQLVRAQCASAGIETSTYTSSCISSPPKISFVVVDIVALNGSEQSLGIENSFLHHAACCKSQLVLIDIITRSQQNLYDCPWYLCNIFWWFGDVITVGETNVCPHNTKLTYCANISSWYIGLHSSKHFKCVHWEFVAWMESVLFSSFNSSTTMFCRGYEAKGARWLNHIADSTPYMCKPILAIWPSNRIYRTSLLYAWFWTLSFSEMLCRGKSLTPKIQFRLSTGLRSVWQSPSYW